MNGRSQGAVDEAVAKLAAATGSVIHGYAGDLSKAAAAEELVKRHPDIEILVNNLGIFEPKPFEEIPDADWIRFFDVNVLSGVRLARSVPAGDEARELGPHHLHLERERVADSCGDDSLRHDQDRADRRVAWPGRVRRRHGHHREQACCPDRPARAVSATFVDALAKAGGKSVAEVEKEFFEKVRPTSLIKRFSSPEEIASLVAYLASPLSSATTGAALRVEGGLLKGAF